MPNSVWENLFKISTNGRDASPTYNIITNLESVELSIDGNVVDWYAMDGSGFSKNFVTAKKLSFKCKAKLTAGDAGNDYIAGKRLAIGTNAQSMFQLTFPTGAVLFGNCTINVSTGLGASEDMDGIEFDVLVDGAPTYSTTASNNLTNLVLTTATLYPTFAAGTYDYVATTTGASITVTPTFSAGVCTITAAGASQNVGTGVASSAISAGVAGTVTPITIVVQEAGKTPKTYNVKLTKIS